MTGGTPNGTGAPGTKDRGGRHTSAPAPRDEFRGRVPESATSEIPLRGPRSCADQARGRRRDLATSPFVRRRLLPSASPCGSCAEKGSVAFTRGWLCPLQRLERLHRLPLDVTVAWRASRGVTVFFRGLRRSTRRTRFWLRALPPCPCPCGRGLRGVSRQDPHLGRKLEMDPLVKFGSPSEYCRGTPPERFFTEVRPAGSRRRLGHYTSPGVPRPYGVLVPGAPFCHDRARAGRGRRGIPLPRRCRPRVFSTPRRFQPRRRT